jgi:DNA-binding NtrC family response regulator
MTTVVWLGPTDDARQLEPVLAKLGVKLLAAADADTAVRLAWLRSAAAVIVAVDWSELAETVVQLTCARPELQILVATRLGVPPQVTAAFDAGARDLLDLKACDPGQIGAAIDRALARHRRAQRERELLMRLHALNEDFLKAMVVIDKRNMELEEILRGASTDDGPAHVLVIDDEATIASLIELVLTDRGYQVTVARDGEAGLTLFEQQAFAIVITDKNLPGKDGVAVMREMKQKRPETDVILITAYGSKESAIAALNTGATAYLEKPFNDIDDIGRKVDEVVALQRERTKKRDLLRAFKQRNRDFLEQYRGIRGELEAWLGTGK